MAIQNNTILTTPAITAGKSAITRKSSQVSVSDIATVSKKPKSADFSMVLSKQQKESIDQALGYDQPGFKQRGALAAYQQVAQQDQRDVILNSMSFHLVV